MLDFDQLLAQASLPEETVPICLDGPLVRRYEEMKARIDARTRAREASADVPRLGAPDPVDEEQADLDALAAHIQDRTVPFLLRAMPRDRFIELIAAYPARQTRTGEPDPRDAFMGANTETLPPALVKASIVDPDVSVGDRWERLREHLTFQQIDRLALVAWVLNKEDREVPFSPGGSPSPRS